MIGTGKTRGLLAVTLGVMALGASGAMAPASHAQTAIGLGGSLFFDDGKLESLTRIGPSRDTDTTKAGNCDIVSGSAWFLYQLDDAPARSGFRVGGELTYRGTYGVQPDDEDDDAYVIGSLLEVAGRGEWSTEIAPKLGVGFGFELGLAMVFVGDDLEDTIEALQAQGVDTGTGPRLGFTVGPSVFGRYALLDRLHATLDVGIHWQALYLLDLEETVHGVAYARELTASYVRFELTLGLELSL